ncbi:hypothetical protein [Allomuricauda sp. R78024]|uniref:hypothetical protein n=1 Tax=Allomuricauda sp. R78024 TaxID=3093867 RepID=UPI0037CC902E
MEKKKLNTVLFFIVVLIWGVILYKFIAPYFKKSEPSITAKNLVEKKVLPIKKKDTIILIFATRDPFLGKLSKTKKQSSVIKPKIQSSKRKKASVPVPWPLVEYLGFVKSKTSNSPLGLVRIDGKLHRVHQNTIVKGLMITKINNNLIQVTNGKESRSFKKK